jgi:oligopeptide transport system substrate-binding protein
MRRRAPNLLVLGTALCAAAASVACSRDNAQAQANVHAAATQIGPGLASIQTLTLSIDNAPTTLDPLLTTETATQHVLDDLFEGLVALGVDGRPVPGVASDWVVSPDGKTWTFHLRADAHWSNGAPVTAQDFIYAWRREVDPKTAAAYAQFLGPLVNAPEIAAGKMPPSSLGVDSPDPRTLVIHLTAPVGYLLDLLDQQYFYPLYEPALSQWGDQWVLPQHMVCNGAFRLQEEERNTRITLAKNPNYWDASHVRLERVTYLVLPDQSIESLRFQSGEVQFAYYFPSSQYSWLKERIGDQAVTAPYLGTLMIEFNVQSPPFKNNPALRRALSMAIDRTALTRYLKQNLNEPAYDLVPPLIGYAQATQPWAQLTDSQRYAEARRAYAEAGYSKDHPLRLELSIPNQGPENRLIFDAIVDMWYRHLGADVALDVRELKVLIQEEQLHKLPLYQLAWIGDYPDALTFLDLFRTGSDANFAQYSNAHFDELISAAERATPAARYQLLSDAEAVLNEDTAMIPLFYYGSRHLIKPYVKGWQSNLIDRHPSRFMYLLEHTSN